MAVKNFILATAGHVDHGKSALVKALTGIDPDRLPEEKARGITIDLGFAHLRLPGGADEFHLGIVDVPGHEDFIKNMVAGVGSIDLALLVVAADDGWMPQTEEHLQILSYLGVQRAVVALTKIDLVPDSEEKVREELRAKLQGTSFEHAPIIPTSVVNGQGIEELKATLAKVLEQTPSPRDYGKPRLPVDRVFSLHGIGTVVTGTLTGGSFSRGQQVIIQPAGIAARIRSIQSHNCEVERVEPGTRTALNLPDVSIADGLQQNAVVQRGDIITIEALGASSVTADVLLIRSGRLTSKPGHPAARPLKDGSIVRIHHGSANHAARVQLLDGNDLKAGEQSLARMKFDAPVFLLAGDRFIVRDWPEQVTLAGGVVLDPDSERHRFHGEAQREFLKARAAAGRDAFHRVPLISSQLARDKAVRGSTLLQKSHFSAEEVAAAVKRLVDTKQAVAIGDWLLLESWWKALQKQAGDFVRAEHAKNPAHLALPLVNLRTSLKDDIFADELFAALLEALSKSGFVVANGTIRHASHGPSLPAALQGPAQKIRAALAQGGLASPSCKELAPDAPAQQALRFLVQTGEAVDLGPDVVLSAQAYASALESVRRFLQQHGSATVSDLRQALGSTRRVMVPLLEKLDRDGVTLRQGDQRTLKRPG